MSAAADNQPEGWLTNKVAAIRQAIELDDQDQLEYIINQAYEDGFQDGHDSAQEGNED